MIFERPDLLVLAPGAIALLTVAIVAQWRRGLRLVAAYGGSTSAERLTGLRLERFPLARWLSLAVAALALVVRIAGPEHEAVEEVPVTPVDLVIAVDLSHSMTAADVEPTRVGRAQTLIREIVDAHVADRVALVLFADWSYDLVPLTDDGNVVTFFAPWVTPDLITGRDQGTSLAPLVGHAVTTWQGRARSGSTPLLLVISDGEVHGSDAEVLAAIDSATNAGLSVWTAGVGSEAGAPLFVPRSDAPLLDGAGRPVIAGYDGVLLEEMAGRGKGTFRDVSTDAGVRRLVADLDDVGGREVTAEALEAPSTGWLLIVAMLLVALDALLDTHQLARMMRRLRAGKARVV